MEIENPYKFIAIGLGIRALMHCVGFSRNFLIQEAEKLITIIKNVGFPVSSMGTLELETFVEELKKTSISALNSKESKELNAIMKKLERIVWAEAKTKSIFIVSEKRYSIDMLLNHPENIFQEGIFSSLNNLARYDFTEGLLCFVCSRPTACSFHILRSMEGILKDVYFKKIKKSEREKYPMLGNMIKGLRNKRIDQTLLDRLDYIRLNYRNPTDHPQDVYTIDDAGNIIGICVEVIDKMAKILKK